MPDSADSSPAGSPAARLQLPILIGLVAISHLSAFVFLPSVGQIAISLGTSVGAVQQTIAAYHMAFAICTLAVGAAADRWDRRHMLLGGALVVAAGGLGAALCGTLAQFVGWRLLQALGASAALVVGRALVMDLYPKERAVAAMASISGAIAVIPMLAPVLGGLLDRAVGWRWIFGLISIYCVLAVLLASGWLAQPRRAHHGASSGVFVGGIGAVLRNRRVLGYCMVVAMGAFAFHLYAVSAPAFLVTHYGFDAFQVGLALGMPPLGFFLSMPLVRRRAQAGGPSIESLLRSAGLALLAAGAAVTLLMVIGVAGWIAIAPMFVVGFANGWILPNAFAGAMRAAGPMQGTASGLLAFLQIASSAVASLLASAVPAQAPWWVGAGIFAASLGALVLVPRPLPNAAAASDRN